MRRLLRVLVVLVVLAVVVTLLTILFVDRLAKTAIEKGGTYALGVETTLEEADIGLVDGRFALTGLAVANPEGFEAPRFLSLTSGRLELSLASLRSDRIEVPSLVLDDLTLSLERSGGKANYDAILKNLERFGSKKGEPQPPAEESGKRFVIREIVLNNVRAEVQLLPIAGELSKTTVTIPVLRLSNLGADEQSLSDLFAAVLDAVLHAVIDVGGNTLPKELLQDLKGKLPDLDAEVKAFQSELEKSLGKDLGGKAGKALDDAKKQLEGLFEKK